MSAPLLQAYVRVIGTDGKAYIYSRSRTPVPYIPDVPVLTKRSQLTGFRASNNGIGGPIIPPPGDITAQRDIDLKPWYGIGSHTNPASPYDPIGPRPDQVGTDLSWAEAQLPTNQWNPPTTQDVQVSTSIGSALAPIKRKAMFGRFQIHPGGRIFANNCMFPGPRVVNSVNGVNSGSAGFPSGESAIIDCADATLVSELKDCSIFAQNPHSRLNGFKGACHKVERCHIFWVIDGDGPHDRIATENNKIGTKVEIVATRIERLVYFVGQYYANHSPNYWNGTGYVSTSSSPAPISRPNSDRVPFWDPGHEDGNHADCIEIHSASGTHTYSGGLWTGDGIHIWGNAFINDDAYGYGDPSTIGVPVPGQSGSPAGSSLGYGDNPKRGLPGGGQNPNQTRPLTSGWTKGKTTPSDLTGVKYVQNGTAIYIGQVRNILFEAATSVIIHNNYVNNGNMGMQEQKKSLTSISFYFYDNLFGPNYYEWNTNRDVYTVRINDLSSGAAMPTDWNASIVKIQPHPANGSQPFGAGGNNKWWDPLNKWGQHLQPLIKGSGTVAGVRFG